MLKTSKLEFHEKWEKKRKNYKRYTNKKRKIKSNPNRTLKMAIKSQQQKIEEEGKKKVQQKQIENKKLLIETQIAINTLNINGLNSPTKRHRLAEWIQKQDPYICCLQETHFRPRHTYPLTK